MKCFHLWHLKQPGFFWACSILAFSHTQDQFCSILLLLQWQFLIRGYSLEMLLALQSNHLFQPVPNMFYWIHVWRLSWPRKRIDIVFFFPREYHFASVLGVIVVLKNEIATVFSMSRRKHGVRQNIEVHLSHHSFVHQWNEEYQHLQRRSSPQTINDGGCFTRFLMHSGSNNSPSRLQTLILRE